MRAFDDICVRPAFDGTDYDEADSLKRSLIKSVIVVAAVGTVVAVATGTMPTIPGLDVYAIRFSLQTAIR